MIKRVNKITALLVAATSIMSVVPAMASERLGTKDGTINYGIAFNGGNYLYDGYRTADDNTGIYYNGGSSDKLVDDLQDYTINSKYGTKYAFATNNNDQYLVDLSTGKVVDNQTDEEKRDTIQGTLRSTLKKTDRYSLTSTFDDVTVGDRLFTGNDQFGDVWYMYSAKGDGNYTDSTTTSAVSANVTVTLPTEGTIVDYATGKSLTIGGRTYVKGTDYTTYAQLVGLVNADVNTWLTANITTTAAVSVPVFAAPALVNGKIEADATIATTTLTSSQVSAINSKYGNGAATNYYAGTTTGTSIKYTGFVNENGKYIDASNLGNIYAYSNKSAKVVKVEEYSKYDKDNQMMVALDSIKPIAQDKDYIYTITTVNIYQGATEDTCNAKSHTDLRTATFYQKIAKAQGDKKDGAYIPKTVDSYEIADNKQFYNDSDANDAYTAVLSDTDGYLASDNMYTVKNGTLYVVRVKSDKVKVVKMKTKKAKVNSIDSTITTKLDAPLLQKDTDNDHDIFDGAGKNAVSLDVDGNVWALDKGSIYKVDGTTFNEVYTLDRSIDNLDVYNAGSLIAWESNNNSNGGVYTTVTEGKAVTNTETPVVTPAKVGWDKLSDGTWNFYDATGAKVVNNWANVGGVWYFLKADGVMATGWQQVGGTWYFLNSSGAMSTGWVNNNGTWYFLQSSGAMKTGWLNDNGTWYYLNASGAMLANTTVDGYALNGSGAWVK
jgi:glucan-binding YG repeat protein